MVQIPPEDNTNAIWTSSGMANLISTLNVIEAPKEFFMSPIVECASG